MNSKLLEKRIEKANKEANQVIIRPSSWKEGCPWEVYLEGEGGWFAHTAEEVTYVLDLWDKGIHIHPGGMPKESFEDCLRQLGFNI